MIENEPSFVTTFRCQALHRDVQPLGTGSKPDSWNQLDVINMNDVSRIRDG